MNYIIRPSAFLVGVSSMSCNLVNAAAVLRSRAAYFRYAQNIKFENVTMSIRNEDALYEIIPKNAKEFVYE